MSPKVLLGSLKIGLACLLAAFLSSGSCQVRYCNDCDEKEEHEEHRDLTVTSHVSVRADAEGRLEEVLVVRTVSAGLGR